MVGGVVVVPVAPVGAGLHGDQLDDLLGEEGLLGEAAASSRIRRHGCVLAEA